MAARSVALFVLFATAALACAASDNIAELQRRFDRERDSVHKAKLLVKLGNAQMEETRHASKAGDFETVGLVMEKYRDNAQAAFQLLKQQHSDAERHMSGYKQLQINVHEVLRDLNETMLIAPDAYKPPLGIVRDDLAAMDDELLKMLFPPTPRKKPPAPAAASPEKFL